MTHSTKFILKWSSCTMGKDVRRVLVKGEYSQIRSKINISFIYLRCALDRQAHCESLPAE